MKDIYENLFNKCSLKDAFCRTQRWPVVNRTEALRYPDWLAYDTAVLEEAGYDVFLLITLQTNKATKDYMRI